MGLLGRGRCEVTLMLTCVPRILHLATTSIFLGVYGSISMWLIMMPIYKKKKRSLFLVQAWQFLANNLNNFYFGGSSAGLLSCPKWERGARNLGRGEKEGGAELSSPLGWPCLSLPDTSPVWGPRAPA